MSWDRTERTLRQLVAASRSAQTEEQCQAVGALSVDALISLAQAVYRSEAHWRGPEPRPSSSDSKRMLEAYIETALSGPANEEFRAFARAAIKLAEALKHKRTASARDAAVVAIVIDCVVRVIAAIENHALPGSDVEWAFVEDRGRYFAWDGPELHALPDRSPIPAPQQAIDALKSAGHTPSFGLRNRLRNYQAEGLIQVFETDRRSWRRELLYEADGDQVLLVRLSGGAT